jgi:hypothetical protein
MQAVDAVDEYIYGPQETMNWGTDLGTPAARSLTTAGPDDTTINV